MFHIVVAGTIVSCFVISALFFAYLAHVVNQRDYTGGKSIRYLTPRSVRKRQNQLKMAELENKISFEHLKHEKLMELREGGLDEKKAIEAIVQGRDIVDNAQGYRYN